jgi:hypothetical protein
MDIDIVRSAAEDIRRAFENLLASSLPGKFPIMFAKFPRGACGDASLILAMYLDKEFELGEFEYVSVGRLSKSDNKKSYHSWLQSGNLFVDITADQFDDAPSAVIVEFDSKWHQTFDIEPQRSSSEVIKRWTNPDTGYGYLDLYKQVKELVANMQALGLHPVRFSHAPTVGL